MCKKKNEAVANSVFDKSILADVGIDIADSAISAFNTSGIPFVSIFAGCIKAGKSFHDYRMSKKLIMFLNEQQHIDKKKEQEFLEKYINGKEENVGWRILEIIDNLNENQKAPLVGKLYKYCIENRLTPFTFFRISHLIANSYYEDLGAIKHFENNNILTSNNKFVDAETLEHLFSYGFLSDCGFSGGDAFGNDNGTRYSLNSLGEILIKIV